MSFPLYHKSIVRVSKHFPPARHISWCSHHSAYVECVYFLEIALISKATILVLLFVMLPTTVSLSSKICLTKLKAREYVVVWNGRLSNVFCCLPPRVAEIGRLLTSTTCFLDADDTTRPHVSLLAPSCWTSQTPSRSARTLRKSSTRLDLLVVLTMSTSTSLASCSIQIVSLSGSSWSRATFQIRRRSWPFHSSNTRPVICLVPRVQTKHVTSTSVIALSSVAQAFSSTAAWVNSTKTLGNSSPFHLSVTKKSPLPPVLTVDRSPPDPCPRYEPPLATGTKGFDMDSHVHPHESTITGFRLSAYSWTPRKICSRKSRTPRWRSTSCPPGP